MTDKVNISPEAVDRLAADHDTVGNDPIKYVMDHSHHWKTANLLRTLSARIAELEAEVETLRYMLPVKVGEFSAALVKKGPTQ